MHSDEIREWMNASKLKICTSCSKVRLCIYRPKEDAYHCALCFSKPKQDNIEDSDALEPMPFEF